MKASALETAIKHFRKIYHASVCSGVRRSEEEELEILTALHDLDHLYKRMTESNRSDFVGWEI